MAISCKGQAAYLCAVAVVWQDAEPDEVVDEGGSGLTLESLKRTGHL